jgi:hypothetical protein
MLTAPDLTEQGYYTTGELEDNFGDLGYFYTDQDGGEGPFFSVVTEDFT